MQATFRSVTWLGIIASVICVIPVLFYDLSEKKHADYIRALKIRAAVRNYKDHTMGEDDIKNIKTISEYAKVENNAPAFARVGGAQLYRSDPAKRELQITRRAVW